MSHHHDTGRIQVLIAPASPIESAFEAMRRADIVEGFAEAIGASSVAGCRYDSIARQIERDKPELVLLVGSCLSDRCDYAGVRKACDRHHARLAFWLQNDPFEFDARVKIDSLADHIFSNDRWAAEFYPRTVTWHLPPAASPRRFAQPAPHSALEKSIDVYFCSAAYANRQQLVTDLAPALRRYRTEIHGPGWNAVKQPFCREQEVDTAGLPTAYAATRVALNIGRQGSPANDRYQIDPSTPAPRTFEAAMSGCCQIFFADSLEVLEYFDLGTEILLFDDVEDFRDQLTVVLADDQQARSIGAAARRRAWRNTPMPTGRGPWSSVWGSRCNCPLAVAGTSRPDGFGDSSSAPKNTRHRYTVVGLDRLPTRRRCPRPCPPRFLRSMADHRA